MEINLSAKELLEKVYSRKVKSLNIVHNGKEETYKVTLDGMGQLKTSHGEFWIYYFLIDDEWADYYCLVKCEELDEDFFPIFKNKKYLAIRTDSGCKTGHVFGDLTCDCGGQLSMAMKTINENKEGMIVHIPNQDGRGRGIRFKLATLMLQNFKGMDTIQSANFVNENYKLNKNIDIRTYAGIPLILKFFNIKGIDIGIATSNPSKRDIFKENGYNIIKTLSSCVEPTELTKHHLSAKREYFDALNR